MERGQGRQRGNFLVLELQTSADPELAEKHIETEAQRRQKNPHASQLAFQLQHLN